MDKVLKIDGLFEMTLSRGILLTINSSRFVVRSVVRNGIRWFNVPTVAGGYVVTKLSDLIEWDSDAKDAQPVLEAGKICSECLSLRSLDEYYRHAGNAGGLLNKCKECVKSKVKKNQAHVGSGYDRTLKGLIRVLYKTQKKHQRKRGHGDIPYTKEELREWLMKSGIEVMYKAWVDSEYDTLKRPSPDRLDSLKGYSLDNLRLVTWGENRARQTEDIKAGLGSGGARCKPVGQHDITGKLIKTYVSASEAARSRGETIKHLIKTGNACKNGFYWKYI